jgi:hypothetical protein
MLYAYLCHTFMSAHCNLFIFYMKARFQINIHKNQTKIDHRVSMCVCVCLWSMSGQKRVNCEYMYTRVAVRNNNGFVLVCRGEL